MSGNKSARLFTTGVPGSAVIVSELFHIENTLAEERTGETPAVDGVELRARPRDARDAVPDDVCGRSG